MQARDRRPNDGIFLEDLCPKFRLRRWRQSLHELTAHRCIYCGERSESIDHEQPKSHGGPSTTENCVPACLACTGQKGDTEAFHWYRSQQFYDPSRAMAIRAWTEGDLRLALKLLQLAPAPLEVSCRDPAHQTRQAASPLWRWQMAA